MQVPARNNQSLLDIALQTLGSAEAAFDIALINGMSITDELFVGQILQIPSMSGYVQRRNAEYYTINSIMPATAITADIANTVLEEGVEFWAVGDDFIVS